LCCVVVVVECTFKARADETQRVGKWKYVWERPLPPPAGPPLPAGFAEKVLRGVGESFLGVDRKSHEKLAPGVQAELAENSSKSYFKQTKALHINEIVIT